MKKQEIVRWLTDETKKREWSAASRNRWASTFSLVFRVGMENEKVERNPASLIRRKTEGNGRVRFLSGEEETALRVAIEKRFPEFLPHFILSIHTGMRQSEQYGLQWSQVDADRRQIHLPKTKNGHPRTIRLNAVALAALEQLRGARSGVRSEDHVFPSAGAERPYGEALQGARGWFPTAVEEAGIKGYSWHCNRHTFASRLVMAGLICEPSRSFLAIGRFRWLCGTNIWLQSIKPMQWIVWFQAEIERTPQRTPMLFGRKRQTGKTP